MDKHGGATMESTLRLWAQARGDPRAQIWIGHVLPRLDAAFHAGHGTPLDVWEQATAEEVTSLFAPHALDATLRHTPAFPYDPHFFDPHCLYDNTWDACTAAAHGFAVHAPWNRPLHPQGGWAGTADDAARVCTAVLRDAAAPEDSGARFLRRLLDHGMSMEPILDTLLVALIDAVAAGNTKVLAPIFVMDGSARILEALFPANPVQPIRYTDCALPLFLACWGKRMHHVDAGRSVQTPAGYLPLAGLTAHQKMQAIAWAKAQGWPRRATREGCAELARRLVDPKRP